MRWLLAVAWVVCTVIPAVAQETKTVTAGHEYAASGTARRWFGEGYRDVWTTPVQVPDRSIADVPSQVTVRLPQL